ncbi:MAG: type II secretion system protein [Methylotenera sp.]|nr:type II secretion system protein [Methylotenera sp.]
MKINLNLKHPSFYQGFTLVEMAIVLVIMGVMLGGLVVSLSAQMDIRNYNETKQKIATIKEGLLGFVVSNRRLPCPDTDGDGVENLAAPLIVNDVPAAPQSTQTFACTNLEGLLPFQTLDADRMDSWSNQFSYRVAPAFSTRAIVWSANGATGNIVGDTYFTLSSSGNITVQTRGDNPATAGITEGKFISNLTSNAAAVIISHGKNGFGATSYTGVPMAAVPAVDVDETLNVTAGTTKLSRLIATGSGACSDTVEGSSFCEFDDVVDWLPMHLIFNRMVTAGQLP